MTGREHRVPGLMVEGVDLDLIDVTLDPPGVPRTLEWCLAVLRETVPDPGCVEVVVTGNMAASVRRRLPEGVDDDNGQPTHGGGISVGKTLRTSEGLVFVFLHAQVFRNDLDAEQTLVNRLLVRRTLVHEAQHVAMHQNGQVYRMDPGASFRDLNLVGGAAAVVEEYRAECSVDAEYRQGEPVWFVQDIIDDVRANLDLAVAEYQVHRDVAQLVFEVTTGMLVAWRGLAYAAARAVVIPEEAGVTESVAADPVWQRAFEARWAPFVDVLGRASRGTDVMPDAVLSEVVDGVADLILGSMTDLGFQWDENQFLIDAGLFESDGFLAALDAIRRAAGHPLRRFRARRRNRYQRGGRIA